MSRAAFIANLTIALARDAVAVLGASLVAYGAWLIFPPAGYIVTGTMLLLASVLSARQSS
jgi:hypothetical protein